MWLDTVYECERVREDKHTDKQTETGEAYHCMPHIQLFAQNRILQKQRTETKKKEKMMELICTRLGRFLSVIFFVISWLLYRYCSFGGRCQSTRLQNDVRRVDGNVKPCSASAWTPWSNRLVNKPVIKPSSYNHSSCRQTLRRSGIIYHFSNSRKYRGTQRITSYNSTTVPPTGRKYKPVAGALAWRRASVGWLMLIRQRQQHQQRIILLLLTLKRPRNACQAACLLCLISNALSICMYRVYTTTYTT